MSRQAVPPTTIEVFELEPAPAQRPTPKPNTRLASVGKAFDDLKTSKALRKLFKEPGIYFKRGLLRTINLWLAVMFIIACACAVPYARWIAENNALKTASAELDTSSELIKSVRAWVAAEAAPNLKKQQNHYAAKFGPIVAAKGVAAKLKEKNPDSYIKFTALQPTNPLDAPTPFELEMINKFAFNRDLKEITTSTNEINSAQYLVRATPEVMSAKCNACHSSPEAASALYREQYSTGFNWPQGEVIGATLIGVPIRDIEENAKQLTINFIAFLTSIFALLFIAISLTMYLVVVYRVKRLAAGANAIAEGEFNHPLKIGSQDEIGAMAQAVEAMRISLQFAASEPQ